MGKYRIFQGWHLYDVIFTNIKKLMIQTFDSWSSSCTFMSVRVKNDLILKMKPETGEKHFLTSQKLDCLAQHPKKPIKSN